MPINQIVFAAFFITATILVFSRGGPAEKNVAIIFIFAAILTPLVESSNFERFQIWVALIDASVFLISSGLAIHYKRKTLYLTCSMLFLMVMSHVARLIVGPVSGWSYGSLVAFCSYLSLAALVWSSFAASGKLQASKLPGEPGPPDRAFAAKNALGMGGVEATILATALQAEARFEERQNYQDVPSEADQSDTALLERLLTFHGCAAQAQALSSVLIQKAGSLGAVVRSPPDRLVRWGATPEVVTAIGLAAQILKVTLKRELFSRPVFSGTVAVLDYFQSELSCLDREELHVLYLNNKYECIHIERHSQGTINHAPFFPREIMRSALEVNAVYMILAHNHPSNDPQPSQTDIRFTRELRDMLRPVGIALLDHLIVARRGHRSMASDGFM